MVKMVLIVWFVKGHLEPHRWCDG